MRRTPLLIALAATALGGCGAERAAQQTSTVVKTVTTSQGAPASTRARDKAPSLRRYEAEAYAVRVPANWTLEEDETPHEGYVESKWRDPNDPNSSITIDASASQAVSAASKAEEVRAAVEGEPSYSEQGFAPTSLGSYSDAFKWTFWLSGDQRIDYFMRECGTGVAVLGSTSPERFASMRPTFRRVAESLKVNCRDRTPAPRTRTANAALRTFARHRDTGHRLLRHA